MRSSFLTGATDVAFFGPLAALTAFLVLTGARTAGSWVTMTTVDPAGDGDKDNDEEDEDDVVVVVADKDAVPHAPGAGVRPNELSAREIVSAVAGCDRVGTPSEPSPGNTSSDSNHSTRRAGTISWCLQ